MIRVLLFFEDKDHAKLVKEKTKQKLVWEKFVLENCLKDEN